MEKTEIGKHYNRYIYDNLNCDRRFIDKVAECVNQNILVVLEDKEMRFVCDTDKISYIIAKSFNDIFVDPELSEMDRCLAMYELGSIEASMLDRMIHPAERIAKMITNSFRRPEDNGGTGD